MMSKTIKENGNGAFAVGLRWCKVAMVRRAFGPSLPSIVGRHEPASAFH
jgi:hypothetical protein